MNRNERYRTDPAYRAKINAQNRAKYHKNMQDPAKARMHHLRARINNAKAAIAHHNARVKFFEARLLNDTRALTRTLNALALAAKQGRRGRGSR